MILHFHLHFIKVQSLHMFRALPAHLQEALHERRFGDDDGRVWMWVLLGNLPLCSAS
jgi:hypothetical protein